MNQKDQTEERFTFLSKGTGREIPIRDVSDDDLKELLQQNLPGLRAAREELIKSCQKLAQMERVVGVLEFEIERRAKTLLIVPKLDS